MGMERGAVWADAAEMDVAGEERNCGAEPWVGSDVRVDVDVDVDA